MPQTPKYNHPCVKRDPHPKVLKDSFSIWYLSCTNTQSYFENAVDALYIYTSTIFYGGFPRALNSGVRKGPSGGP